MYDCCRYEQWREPIVLPKRASLTGKGSPRPSARAVAQADHLCFERENASLRRGDLASAS